MPTRGLNIDSFGTFLYSFGNERSLSNMITENKIVFLSCSIPMYNRSCFFGFNFFDHSNMMMFCRLVQFLAKQAGDPPTQVDLLLFIFLFCKDFPNACCLIGLLCARSSAPGGGIPLCSGCPPASTRAALLPLGEIQSGQNG